MKLVKQILKQKWIKSVKRENSPLLESILRIGATKKNKELEFDNRMNTLVIKGEVHTNNKHFNRLKKEFIKLCKRDIAFLENYFNKIENDCKQFIRHSKQLSKNKFDQLSNTEINKIFFEYIEKSLVIASHLWPILMPEEWLMNEIEKELKKFINYEKDFITFKRIINEITAPSKPSTEQKRKLEVLKLASAIYQKDWEKNDYMSKIIQIYKKYAWVNDHYLNFNYTSIEETEKEIKKEANMNARNKLLTLKKEIMKRENRKKTHYRQLNYKEKLMMLSEHSSKMPNIRFLRLEVISHSAFILKDMFMEIEKRLGYNPARLFYYEICDMLANPKTINLKNIKSRKVGVSSVMLKGKFYELKKYEVAILKRKLNDKIDRAEKIQGTPACLGYVKGKARVLLSSKDISKLKSGEILITAMTTPEYLPAMKKAAAFITDEGGISCHAAIVSRELKKPCIIGTKIATKVLKDGDYVEVDANKGIVKKIS